MELNSFRDLLLKKTEGNKNPYLQDLIKYAKDEMIIQHVLESLEKMAQPSAAMGRGANSAVTTYAGQLTRSDVEQVKDALAHHISHYRGALKAGARDVADQHLSKIIPLMHLIGRASKHSGGKLALDYRSTTPWESNYTTVDRHDHNGKLKEGTKDLGRRPKKVRDGNPRGVPDYRYLEMPPHGTHADTGKLSKPDSGYPFEETQVGSQEEVDSGKGWLHLEDTGPVTEFKAHPFDAHPVHEHADHSEHDRAPEAKEKFVNDLAAWRSSDHHKQWMAGQKEKFQKDPEAYKSRGKAKPSHFWEGLSLQSQPDHAKAKASAPTASTPKAPTVEAPATPKVESPAAPAPEAQASAPTGNEDQLLAHIRSTLKPEHVKSMSPEMKRILKIKD